MAKQKYTEDEDLVVPHSESFDMVVEQLAQDVEHVSMTPVEIQHKQNDIYHAFGKTLKGEPEQFAEEYFDILKGLVAQGIAADFGDGVYGRGFAWHSTYGG